MLVIASLAAFFAIEEMRFFSSAFLHFAVLALFLAATTSLCLDLAVVLAYF